MLFQHKEPPTIISVGGGLIVPEGIDSAFLNKLNIFIREHVKKGKRFFLVAGGGRTARNYRDAGKAVIGNLTEGDQDWLGIHATRLNAHLLRTIFQDIAHPRIIENYDKKLYNWKEPVVIGAGWKPGFSSDYDAVILAKDYNANLIINLSNIDWVYDKDPRKYPDAQPIKRLTWEEMELLVGTKWIPGMNAPFDPIAAQLAKSMGLTVIVANGNDFKNMDKIIECDAFKGTVIMPYRIDASYYDREYYLGKGDKLSKRGETFYSAFTHSIIRFYRALMIKLFINPRTCLDVGCGTGGMVKWLRFFGVDAHGVEISKQALEMADESIKPYLRQGDITRLPIDDKAYDLVVTFDVLEHVERGKIKKAVEESIRVAKKYVLHKIYTRENLWIEWFHARDFSHVSIFSRRHWGRIFGEVEKVKISDQPFFRLPTFFESIFLLKK
ncbi:MAG: hypothetical protein RI947_296 [Candidatus Parcubacteria bacterium]|jgi:uridylate kinase